MSTLMLTIREGIQYRGRSGHWSWIAHRISGLAILLFLVIHVWETATVHYSPNFYRWIIDVFKWPPIALSEIPLMAAVLFHAFNGIRITLLDFKPEWWKYQQRSAIIVWAVFLILFIPIAIFMFMEMINHWQHLGDAWMNFPKMSAYQ